jgi:outer membrane biosynthesis protein TonB
MQDPLITPTPKLTRWLDKNFALEFSFRRSIVMGAALSILFHILLLIFLPERKQKVENEDATSSQPMVVRLNPLQARPPAAAPAEVTPPTPVPPAAPPKPRILSVPNPVSKSPMAPVPLEPPPPPVIPPKPVDPRTEPPSMMARVEEARARRQALEDAAKSENAESRSNGSDPSAADRTAGNINKNLANLGRARDGTSGVFQIINKGYRTGSFSFRGWTTNRSDSYRRVIEVDAGQGGDIERAMVRRMIELIREHYQADFSWDSHRLGRVVKLSARKEDSAGLEDFLLSEFSEFNPPTARGAPPSSPPPPRRN